MAEAANIFTQPQVRYHIIEDGLLEVDVKRLRHDLTEGGAVAAAPSSSPKFNRVNVDDVTHIITRTIDFPDYVAILDHVDKYVVTPEWVSASVTKGKLATPRQYSPDPKMFFSGLVVACDDLPQGDKDAIAGYVLAVGGLYTSTITKLTTHIVALTVESEKCQAAIRKGLNCKIVLPHWVDDCLKLRARIDERPYCLPDPEIMTRSSRDKVPDVDRNDLRGASSTRPTPLPTPLAALDSKQPLLTVFKSQKVMLHSDLQISARLQGVLEDHIIGGGGSVTGSVHKADMLICQFRDSRDYRIASRANRDVGNLAWLYHLITYNRWTSPMRQLLHYPIPAGGIPGFNSFRISVSNYNGEARIYLENLAGAAGAQFTKTMKDDNTHLITAHPNSEKCTAAKEWNINIVNHLWLEESYARCQVQTLSNALYTQFPPRTNLGEVVGNTQIDPKAVEQKYFPIGSDREEQDEAGNVDVDGVVKAGSTVPSRTKPVGVAQDALRTLQADGSTPRASKANRRHTDSETAQTPAARAMYPGKENETPSTTGSRSAKAKAAARLHDLAPDIALFEKETKRVGGVIHGGRKRSGEFAQTGIRKRSKSNEHSEGTEASLEDVKTTKKAKKSSDPSSIKLLLTGYKRWIGQPSKVEYDDTAQLGQLGIEVVAEAEKCTHLASPKVIRTPKFICALAFAPILLSSDFVDDCLDQNRRLDPNDYILEDKEFENSSGYTMEDSLAGAAHNKGQLLKAYTIYCTEHARGGFENLVSIAKANGASCTLYRGRAGADSALRAASADEGSDTETKPEEAFLLSGTTPQEAKIWSKFRSMAEKYNKIPRIVQSDWLLHAALSQKLQSSEEHALSESDVDS